MNGKLSTPMHNGESSLTVQASQKPNPNQLEMRLMPGETETQAIGRLAVDPILSNALTGRNFRARVMGDDLTLEQYRNALQAKAEEVHKGDLRHAESILIAQATTLDAAFHELIGRAVLNMGTHMEATEAYMRLALRAQNQCRASLESLAAIKNPTVVFAKQANVTSGPQQNNFGVAPVPETQSTQNELLESQHANTLDTGAPSETSRVDQNMETVGVKHRPKKR